MTVISLIYEQFGVLRFYDHHTSEITKLYNKTRWNALYEIINYIQ